MVQIHSPVPLPSRDKKMELLKRFFQTRRPVGREMEELFNKLDIYKYFLIVNVRTFLILIQVVIRPENWSDLAHDVPRLFSRLEDIKKLEAKINENF
ncbi:MAG: hypothetical protein ACXQS8_08720 [Candidatus Helarchaeales archaeon]